MSWFNSGASKFAKRMGADKGLAPKGMKFMSLDVSSWDASMKAFIMKKVRDLHLRVIKEVYQGRN